MGESTVGYTECNELDEVIMNKSEVIMFYDGGCPLCSREVAHYQGLDKAGRVRWIDITRDFNLLEAFGVSYGSAMQRLHVLSSDGRLLTGAYGFAAIWSELPYYRHLAKLVRFPGLLPLLDKAYEAFAGWRYQRRCSSEACQVSTPCEQRAEP
jgi:predicted DCC family thiol-disulfide oxidoreductase YuxK